VCNLLKSQIKSRNCKSNQVVINQISTLSNQIFFSQIKSPLLFNHNLNQIMIWCAHHWSWDDVFR